ncbi:hypothetical protein BGW38_004293 [Lunasporangiospora selenospora]|uniref:Kelch motif-containing protein n=1 Tax=Lunasporangiospora selenospora TaxID=979761 RepID=A0A9P6FRJ0_9FUNG|nr:hypothetical protein BGW38_004293 [Lunasporangiospora selenospora]
MFIEGGFGTKTFVDQFVSLNLTVSWSAQSPAWSVLPNGTPNSHQGIVGVPPKYTGKFGIGLMNGFLLSVGGTQPSSFWSAFDLDAMRWVNLTGIKVTYPFLEGHSVVMNPDTGLIYVLGGYWNATATYNDIMVLDPNIGHIQGSVSTTLAASRADAGAVWSSMRKSILVIGGTRGLPDPPVGSEMSIIAEYDTSISRWKNWTTTGQIPPARLDHCAAATDDGSKIIVFGGSDGKVFYETLYILDVASGVWTAGASADSKPPKSSKPPTSQVPGDPSSDPDDTGTSPPDESGGTGRRTSKPASLAPIIGGAAAGAALFIVALVTIWMVRKNRYKKAASDDNNGGIERRRLAPMPMKDMHHKDDRYLDRNSSSRYLDRNSSSRYHRSESHDDDNYHRNDYDDEDNESYHEALAPRGSQNRGGAGVRSINAHSSYSNTSHRPYRDNASAAETARSERHHLSRGSSYQQQYTPVQRHPHSVSAGGRFSEAYTDEADVDDDERFYRDPDIDMTDNGTPRQSVVSYSPSSITNGGSVGGIGASAAAFKLRQQHQHLQSQQLQQKQQLQQQREILQQQLEQQQLQQQQLEQQQQLLQQQKQQQQLEQQQQLLHQQKQQQNVREQQQQQDVREQQQQQELREHQQQQLLQKQRRQQLEQQRIQLEQQRIQFEKEKQEQELLMKRREEERLELLMRQQEEERQDQLRRQEEEEKVEQLRRQLHQHTLVSPSIEHSLAMSAFQRQQPFYQDLNNRSSTTGSSASGGAFSPVDAPSSTSAGSRSRLSQDYHGANSLYARNLHSRQQHYPGTSPFDNKQKTIDESAMEMDNSRARRRGQEDDSEDEDGTEGDKENEERLLKMLLQQQEEAEESPRPAGATIVTTPTTMATVAKPATATPFYVPPPSLRNQIAQGQGISPVIAQSQLPGRAGANPFINIPSFTSPTTAGASLPGIGTGASSQSPFQFNIQPILKTAGTSSTGRKNTGKEYVPGTSENYVPKSQRKL